MNSGSNKSNILNIEGFDDEQEIKEQPNKWNSAYIKDKNNQKTNITVGDIKKQTEANPVVGTMGGYVLENKLIEKSKKPAPRVNNFFSNAKQKVTELQEKYGEHNPKEVSFTNVTFEDKGGTIVKKRQQTIKFAPQSLASIPEVSIKDEIEANPNLQKIVDALFGNNKEAKKNLLDAKPEYKYHLSKEQKDYLSRISDRNDNPTKPKEEVLKNLQDIENNLNREIKQIKQKATARTSDEEDLLNKETQRLFKLKMVEVYRDVKGQYPQTDEELDKFIVSDLKQDLKAKLNKYREKAMHYNANFKIEDTGGVVTDYREKNFNTDVFNGVLTKYNNIISKIPANDNEYNIDRLQRALNEINSDLTKLNGVYEWAVVKKELNIAQPLDKNMVDKLNDFIKQRQKLRGLIEINSPDSKTANELYNKKRAEIYNNNFNPSLEDKVKEVNNKITNEFDKIKTDIKADLVKCLSFVQPNKDTKELKQQAEKFINDNINQGTDIDKIKAFKDKIQNTYNAMDEFYDKKVDLHNLQNQENPEIEIDKNELAKEFESLKPNKQKGLPSPSEIKPAIEAMQEQISEFKQQSANDLRGTSMSTFFKKPSGNPVNQSRLGAGAGGSEFEQNDTTDLYNMSNQSSIALETNHRKKLKEQQDNEKGNEKGAGAGI